jgi:NAD dependent epimerase/dehydratase family enzyme
VRIPAPLLRAALGELAELFVDGQRVVPERLRALGFEFRYPTIDAALEQALGGSAGLAERVSGVP